MTPTYTIYEQPTNEHIRVCLRLEQLFEQASYGAQGSSLWDTRLSLAAIVDIINILDRPDLKTKLTKELHRHLMTLNKLKKTPDVDREKLSSLLADIENLIDILHATTGKIAQDVRENEFLNIIRSHSTTPSGASHFDTPACYLWLQRPSAERNANIIHWLKSFAPISLAVKLLLNLARESCSPQDKIAHRGFFQIGLDPQIPCQLIRISIPSELRVYPGISVGRHGIAIRFFDLSISERPLQTHHDVAFKLTTCVI